VRWWFVNPDKVMWADFRQAGSCGKQTDCMQLLDYIRGRYTELFRRHCFRVYTQVAMPMHNHFVENQIELKVRPAVHAGGDIYFWCYTHGGTYRWAGVLVERPTSEPSRVDNLPMYIPSSLVSKENRETLINWGTKRVRDQSLIFPWLPKKISPRLHQS
jgi:hypothetical protein